MSRQDNIIRQIENQLEKQIGDYDIVDKELVKKGEEPEDDLEARCQKGYKTHPTRKTKKMYGKTYRNCVKAEE